VRVFSTTNPAFNQPAIAAILQWVFKPGEVDGQPASVRMRQEIIFNLQ
jgi:outer membrane biosynthesis protein TonB